MKFNFKRLASSVLAIGMLASMSSISAFAADAGLANGDYKGTVHFHNASNPANYSMCDPIFAHEADVVLTDANAELTVYVAYPVPAFSDQGTDGTIKDVTITIGEDTYNGESDITTKAVKTFDIGRIIVGSDHRKLIPFTMLLGAFCFLLADTLGRSIAYPYEISASIIMSVAGGIAFVILLQRSGMIHGK